MTAIFAAYGGLRKKFWFWQILWSATEFWQLIFDLPDPICYPKISRKIRIWRVISTISKRKKFTDVPDRNFMKFSLNFRKIQQRISQKSHSIKNFSIFFWKSDISNYTKNKKNWKKKFSQNFIQKIKKKVFGHFDCQCNLFFPIFFLGYVDWNHIKILK